MSDKTARFWDKHALGYSKRPIADDDAYQEKLSITREYFTPEMDVLEIGCGTGATAVLHAPYVRSIRGVDVSPKMLEIAQGRADEAGAANVSFECARVDEIDAQEGSVDAVLALSILHLLEDDGAALRDIYKWLKPGGVFVSSTACISDMMPIMRYIAPVGRALGLLPYLGFFSADDLRRNIVGAGFEITHEWLPKPKAAIFIVAKKPE